MTTLVAIASGFLNALSMAPYSEVMDEGPHNKRSSGLKGHPGIVPFEHFIVDGDKRCLIGFTAKFVLRGTLEDIYHLFPFHLSWVVHRMQIVDDINLKYGVMHRDMAARNLGFCSGHEAITPVYFEQWCKNPSSTCFSQLQKRV